MRRRQWQLIGAFALSTLAGPGCSGGSEPVITVGSFDRDPGQPGPGVLPGNYSQSTLSVLCTNACIHLLPAHCSGMAATAESCEAECTQASGGAAAPLECSNELAALYVCMAAAPLVCPDGAGSGDVCTPETAALKSCATPSAGGGTLPGCVRYPSGDPGCPGGRSFYQCASPPAGDCTYAGSQSYCCIVP